MNQATRTGSRHTMTRRIFESLVTIFIAVALIIAINFVLNKAKGTYYPVTQTSIFELGDIPQDGAYQCTITLEKSARTFTYTNQDISYQALITHHEANVLSRIMGRMHKSN
jgi:hypothetical protein